MPMPSSITAPEGQLSRRDKFRAYMQAFNPTAPAREIIDAGLVFEDLHQSLYRKLAARADLEPGSQQLLVGGVGSGKTTELILADNWLACQGHVLPLYIDISAETDLSALNAGALLASFGLHLSQRLFGEFPQLTQGTDRFHKLKEAYERLKVLAYGRREVVRKVPSPFAKTVRRFPFETRTIPGKIQKPLPPLNRELKDIRASLKEFLNIAQELHKDIVVAFDGLDRLLDATKFWSVVHQDIRLLRELKVSAITTAPLSVLFGVGVGQSISDHFDRVHHLAVIASDPENASLRSVLEMRRASDVLYVQAEESICQYSGGVLRDLISLARDAGEEAYVSDRDFITAADVEKVAHQLGTGYLRGLGPEAINTLLELESSRSFKVDLAANIELLATRRVLEYSSTDFRVHPALLSVIPRPEPKRA